MTDFLLKYSANHYKQEKLLKSHFDGKLGNYYINPLFEEKKVPNLAHKALRNHFLLSN